MAVVAKVKRKDDKKYSRLKEIYKSEETQTKTESLDLDSIDLKKFVKEKKLTRKEILVDVAIMAILILVSASGYLISKIV